MQAGKGKLVLGLDPHATQEGHVRGSGQGVLKQGCLPDSGLTAQHQHRTAPASGPVQQLVHNVLLGRAP